MGPLKTLSLAALGGTVLLNTYLVVLMHYMRKMLVSWAWTFIFSGFLLLFGLVALAAWHLAIIPIPNFRYIICFGLLGKAACFAVGFKLFCRDLRLAQQRGLFPLRITHAPKLEW